MKYKLKNLNLGENPPIRKFSIGPYNIELCSDYDSKQRQLSDIQKVSSIPKVIDGKIKKAKLGKNLITAIVICDNEPDSILSNSSVKGIWDLCQILSYLSGHSVFLPKDQRRYHHIKYKQEIVQRSEIPIAAKIAWNNRRNFSNEKEMRPFWYYLNMNRTQEAEIILLLGCVSLEIIQSIEYDKSSINISPQLQNLINDIKLTINESDVEIELKNSLKSTVGNWGSSSSAESFKYLLIKYGFIENNINGISLKRITGINKLRNGIVHRGEIEYPKWIRDKEVQKKVALFITAQFIPALIEEYLRRKFELNGFIWIEQNESFIQEYIYNGTWNGERIESG